jgi:hypothetical protein
MKTWFSQAWWWQVPKVGSCQILWLAMTGHAIFFSVTTWDVRMETSNLRISAIGNGWKMVEKHMYILLIYIIIKYIYIYTKYKD